MVYEIELDRPPAIPTPSPLPKVEHEWDLFDYVVFFSVGAIPIICIIAIGCMLFGSLDAFLILGVSCLLLSLFFLAKYAQLKVEIAKGQEEALATVSALSIRESDLHDAIFKFTEFQENFDQLVEKEYKRVSEKFKDAEQMHKFALNRNSTIDRLGKRLLNDTVKSISSRLTANNFTASSDRLRKTIEFCQKHEYDVTASLEQELFDNLRREFEDAIRKQHAKEEQARIKARIREEQRAEKELEKEMRRIESEKTAIEKALVIALRKAQDEYSEEVESLREKLREAEEKAKRAISMAQQTKAGHVYVISNIGSFGEEVFKIGMTRRLEPMDRVKELSVASVPFPFDVHMMISCDNAPALENTLHKNFHNQRLNKVNLRREFFRVSLEEIRKVVEEHHGEVAYVAKPEALQYRESMEMSDEDFSYITTAAETYDLGDDDSDFIQ